MTHSAASVDSSKPPSRKHKYPVTTRRRIPSVTSTTSDGGHNSSSSVFYNDDSLPRKGGGGYPRGGGFYRGDSFSRDYPSDTESIASCSSSSRIPRYIGGRRSHSTQLTDSDVQQIVDLVRSGGGDKQTSSELLIKKDPHSRKWAVASASQDKLVNIYTLLQKYGHQKSFSFFTLVASMFSQRFESWKILHNHAISCL